MPSGFSRAWIRAEQALTPALVRRDAGPEIRRSISRCGAEVGPTLDLKRRTDLRSMRVYRPLRAKSGRLERLPPLGGRDQQPFALAANHRFVDRHGIPMIQHPPEHFGLDRLELGAVRQVIEFPGVAIEIV